jgi:hypothetical protein
LLIGVIILYKKLEFRNRKIRKGTDKRGGCIYKNKAIEKYSDSMGIERDSGTYQNLTYFLFLHDAARSKRAKLKEEKRNNFR